MKRWTRSGALAPLALGAALLSALALSTAPASGAVPRHIVKPAFSPTAVAVGNAGNARARAARVSATVTLPGDTTAYGVQQLWNQGVTGAGTTVALIESFGDPDVQAFADAYDSDHGLPRANISTITPAGALPPCTDATAPINGCRDWIGETDLDVAMVHAMAPSAQILIVASPVNETQGFTGLPEMMEGIKYVTQHSLAQVISMSLSATEETFPSFASIKTLDPALNQAYAAGIPITAATGDCGATSNTFDSAYQCQQTYPFRASGFPAVSPKVIALGGTTLQLDADGNRVRPDQLIDFSGAGFSKTYARPAFQRGVASITGSQQRSVPDITMDGQSGTSQSAPLFAGVLALATQVNHGHNLGPVNDALYAMGPRGTKAGIVDVTQGDNTLYGVTGFSATTGFDVASGWGTVDPVRFVPALVAQLKKVS